MFFSVFTLLCAQLFKGKFFYCDGINVSNITNKTECLQAGYRWLRRKYNFDNLGQVCHTLGQTSALTDCFHDRDADLCAYHPARR